MLCSAKSATEVPMPWELHSKSFVPYLLFPSYPFYLKRSFTNKNIIILHTAWTKHVRANITPVLFHHVWHTYLWTRRLSWAQRSGCPRGQMGAGGALGWTRTFTTRSEGCTAEGQIWLPCATLLLPLKGLNIVNHLLQNTSFLPSEGY